MTHLPIHARLLIAAAATLAFAGCNRPEDRTVGQQIDSTVAKAEQKTEQATQDVKDAAAKAEQKIEQAGAAATDKIADASITASVNAALASDPDLSALRINVDTSNGAVSLKGTAPSAAARDKATTIAAAVKGVTSVDNRLEVRG